MVATWGKEKESEFRQYHLWTAHDFRFPLLYKGVQNLISDDMFHEKAPNKPDHHEEQNQSLVWNNG